MDAFIAIGIIIIGIIVIYSYNPASTSREQANIFSNDILLILSSTKVQDLNVPIVNEYVLTGVITNIDNTIMEQIAEFYHRDQIYGTTDLEDYGGQMLALITDDIIPKQYGVSYLIEDTLIMTRNSLTNTSNNILTSRNIASGIFNSTHLWGPYKTEVRIFQ